MFQFNFSNSKIQYHLIYFLSARLDWTTWNCNINNWMKEWGIVLVAFIMLIKKLYISEVVSCWVSITRELIQNLAHHVPWWTRSVPYKVSFMGRLVPVRWAFQAVKWTQVDPNYNCLWPWVPITTWNPSTTWFCV